MGDGFAYKIAQVDFIRAEFRQLGALNKKFGAFHCLGGVTAAHILQHCDETIVLYTELLDLDFATRGGEERAIGGDRFRGRGKAFQLHFALDAVGAGDDADTNEIMCRHRSRP